DLEPADGREGLPGVAEGAGVEPQGRRDHGPFVVEYPIVDPRAPPHGVVGRGPVSADRRADAAVVLPIPISPRPTASAPAAIARTTAACPASRAASSSAGVIAGSCTKLRELRRTFAATTRGSSGSSASTPTSTTS